MTSVALSGGPIHLGLDVRPHDASRHAAAGTIPVRPMAHRHGGDGHV